MIGMHADEMLKRLKEFGAKPRSRLVYVFLRPEAYYATEVSGDQVLRCRQLERNSEIGLIPMGPIPFAEVEWQFGSLSSAAPEVSEAEEKGAGSCQKAVAYAQSPRTADLESLVS